MVSEDDTIPSPPWRGTHPNPLTPNLISRRRHIHPNLQQFGAKPLMRQGQVVGICLSGWEIGTSQGPIGDVAWFDKALGELEPLSQCMNQCRELNATPEETPKRQLALPEMVFPLAHVILDFRPTPGPSVPAVDELYIGWDAMGCLREWASAHQAIPLPVRASESNETSTSIAADQGTTNIENRGVSVLQSSDAALWKNKQRLVGSESASLDSTSSPILGTTSFHYDWTYSSAYIGKIAGTGNLEVGAFSEWRSLEQSGMPLSILTDQSVPILYFDEVVLLEDDLHDNGQMQYTAKIRVMPTCIYVLFQLFVRVDNVLIRLRETRLMVHFASCKVYRDVSWRQCTWSALPDHNVPTNVKAWTQESYNRPNIPTSPHQRHAQPQSNPAMFAQLLQRIPFVEQPSDIPRFAELYYKLDRE
eukprot:Nitzschia sp. Nitz4//scaffold26_size159584//108026//109279//NITZ4_002503-RA/size159584-processed-gene-0.239-mRNA-1//-1//CDS//3329545118//2397//frame0